jgi:hypothetical protein
MRVRCRATADYRSNAVGSVELECTPAGLCVALRGVSSYRDGYAPGPPARDAEVCVPWASVYATRLGEEELLLSVAATLLPLNRFRLGEFSEVLPDDAAAAARRRRLRGWLGGAAAALLVLVLALSVRGALPEPRVLRTLGAAAVLAACVLFFARRASGARTLSSPEVLREFSDELALQLPNHLPMEPAAPPPRAARLPDLAAFLPRSAVGVAITLAATSLAALVSSTAARPEAARGDRSAVGALGSWAVLRSVAPDSAASPAPAAQAMPLPSSPAQSPAPSPAPPPSEEKASEHGPTLSAACACPRAGSLLWGEPLPRLAALVVGSRMRAHEEHLHAEVDVALVNDGDRPLDRVAASVIFYEQRPAPATGQRQTGERPLRLERPLPPGGMMLWHVEARGSSFDLVGADLGTLAADGADAAPAEAFASLASADARVLRLHAARLLAFLGDERAGTIARALERSAKPAEAAFLQRLLEPAPSIAACDLAVRRASDDEWHLQACLDNRSEQPRSSLDLRLLAFDAGFDPQRPGGRAPLLLGEQTTRAGVELAAHSGRRVELSVPLSIDSGALPRAFELRLDEDEEQTP